MGFLFAVVVCAWIIAVAYYRHVPEEPDECAGIPDLGSRIRCHEVRRVRLARKRLEAARKVRAKAEFESAAQELLKAVTAVRSYQHRSNLESYWRRKDAGFDAEPPVYLEPFLEVFPEEKAVDEAKELAG